MTIFFYLSELSLAKLSFKASLTVHVFTFISITLPLLLACLHVFPLPCAPFFSASSKIKTAALYIANALSWRRS